MRKSPCYNCLGKTAAIAAASVRENDPKSGRNAYKATSVRENSSKPGRGRLDGAVFFNGKGKNLIFVIQRLLNDMKKLILTIALCGMGVLAFAQEAVRFHPEFSFRDFRAEYGVYTAAGVKNAPLNRTFTLSYTANFWGPMAYKAGVQGMFPGFDYGMHVGMPLAIAYRPGIRSLGNSLLTAAEMSISDTVLNGYYGTTDRIGSDILANFIMALFRRSEYYVGLTPGLYSGTFNGLTADEYGQFSLTLDVGLVLSIPIWHFSLNIHPAYHYGLAGYPIQAGDLRRSMFSIAGGIGWLF